MPAPEPTDSIPVTGEFGLIARYFMRDGLAACAAPGSNSSIVLGPGDDCALLSVPHGQHLVVSMDNLVEGVHFPSGAPAALLAQRALRVNLSDLAAMGAEPLGFSLGLTLPAFDEGWLQALSDGLLTCSQAFACPLLGGNTTRGPLNIAIQVHGTVPAQQELRRSGARPGHKVYISGALGKSATVAVVTGKQSVSEVLRRESEQAFYRPEPHLELGVALRGLASACLDVSDGLLADLGHLAEASGVHVAICANDVPVLTLATQLLSDEQAMPAALCGGDDYILAFTVPASREAELSALGSRLGLSLTCIGEVFEAGSAGPGVSCKDAQGMEINFDRGGYRHF